MRYYPQVAPRVGAWIETRIKQILRAQRSWSHPVWVRGLKPNESEENIKRIKGSHPVWVRGLKLVRSKYMKAQMIKSHPVWVRGLKRIMDVNPGYTASGRTPCGCVD